MTGKIHGGWRCCQNDGRNPAGNQLSLVVYPIIYRRFIHPRWLAGFLKHQQYFMFTLLRTNLLTDPFQIMDSKFQAISFPGNIPRHPVIFSDNDRNAECLGSMLPFLGGHWIPTDIQLSCQRMQSDAGPVISESTWWKLYINMAACALGSLVKAFHEERQSCWSVTNLRSTRPTTCELMCLCSFRPCSCQYSVSGHCLFKKWTTKKCSTHCQSSTDSRSDVYVGNVFKTCHI